MTIDDHLKTFGGLPVWTFDPAAPVPAGHAVRVGVVEYDDGQEVFLAACEGLATRPEAAQLTALVIGDWAHAYESDSSSVVAWLVANHARFPALTSVFLGDMVMEECEISWIQQSDLSPLVAAFPQLQELGARGGNDLAFSPVASTELRRIVFETGGLPHEAVAGVISSDLPALAELEFWLGTDQYGGTTTVEHLVPLFTSPPPALRSLGLCNAEEADYFAKALATAPVVAQLDTLDLSMGTLTDDGARALLAGQPLGHLQSIDLTDNYLSDELAAELAASDLNIDASAQKDLDEDEDIRYLYPSVTE